MIQFMRRLFELSASGDSLTRVRSRFIQAIALIGIVTSAIGLVTQFQVDSTVFSLIFTASYIVINAGILWLVSRRRVALAGITTVVIFLVAAITVPAVFLLLALLAIISAAALASRPVYLVTNMLILARLLLTLVERAADVASIADLSDEITMGIIIVIVSITARYFIINTERSLHDARRRARMLQATNEVGQIATTILDLQELFNRSVDLIQVQFGFYHVQVFMVRDDMAELVASTGEAGQQLLVRQHRLEVGSNSVIGRVTQDGKPVLARDTDSDARHRRNPLLPDTQAELAVPILDRDEIIGALDLQSTQSDAFQDEDVQALQAMANLLSTAIRNAHLFSTQQVAVQEQQHLIRQSEANLLEIQRLNRQLTRFGWDEYVEQSSQVVGITLEADQIMPGAGWSDSLIEAIEQRKAVVRQANGRPGVVAVPVTLRGEVIGAIEVEASDSSVQGEAVETMEALAQRLATSLDNARLFEEAQVSTVQEQRINTIVARYQSATSVDDLLQITLTELSEALGAQRGAIRLGKLPDENTNGGAT